MLYREVIAGCSEIYTIHINILYGQKVELLKVKLAVHVVTTVSTLHNFRKSVIEHKIVI
jgi:hypothetical protein